ncbi:MAG TPA: hypothetical protein VGA49_01425 [Patescibacteria group bacterium]
MEIEGFITPIASLLTKLTELEEEVVSEKEILGTLAKKGFSPDGGTTNKEVFHPGLMCQTSGRARAVRKEVIRQVRQKPEILKEEREAWWSRLKKIFDNRAEITAGPEASGLAKEIKELLDQRFKVNQKKFNRIDKKIKAGLSYRQFVAILDLLALENSPHWQEKEGQIVCRLTPLEIICQMRLINHLVKTKVKFLSDIETLANKFEAEREKHLYQEKHLRMFLAITACDILKKNCPTGLSVGHRYLLEEKEDGRAKLRFEVFNSQTGEYEYLAGVHQKSEPFIDRFDRFLKEIESRLVFPNLETANKGG